jgi:hypothetical protein
MRSGEHMKILYPRDLCEIDWSYGPLFFLAGPIKGGGDWQFSAASEIQKLIKHFYVADPHRPDIMSSLWRRPEKGEPHFDCNTTWERHYMKLAATCNGCIIFWLPCESERFPRKGGPYARDTYGELGAWRTHLSYNPSWRVVFGAEENFPGLKVFKKNLFEDMGKVLPVYSTLQDTVAAAVKLAATSPQVLAHT